MRKKSKEEESALNMISWLLAFCSLMLLVGALLNLHNLGL